MTKQRTIRRTLLAMALVALGVGGTARADVEMEPNDDFTQPQALQFDAEGAVAVWGAIENPSMFSPDVDYYSLQLGAGELVTLDVDGTSSELDTVLYVFDPTGKMRFIAQDTDPVDVGSSFYPTGGTGSYDPSLQFSVDVAGTWKVAVVAMPAVLNDNGAWTTQEAHTGGTYTFLVLREKPATPSMQQITIDIKPGNRRDPTPIRAKAKGTIPVALLSNSEFDPLAIDVTSLRFGRTGNEASLERCAKDTKDLNGDGKRDRVCYFDNDKTGFTRMDTVAILKGTKGDQVFQGKGDLKVFPQKRHKHHSHYDDRGRHKNHKHYQPQKRQKHDDDD